MQTRYDEKKVSWSAGIVQGMQVEGGAVERKESGRLERDPCRLLLRPALGDLFYASAFPPTFRITDSLKSELTSPNPLSLAHQAANAQSHRQHLIEQGRAAYAKKKAEEAAGVSSKKGTGREWFALCFVGAVFGGCAWSGRAG
jgi:hypothetical protein